MKRKMILMMVMLFFAVVCPAQSIRNSNNSLLGKVGSDGTVRNSNNSVIGYAKGSSHALCCRLLFLPLLDVILTFE